MTPIHFKEVNQVIARPKDIGQSQCEDIVGYVGELNDSQCSNDGATVFVVAWKPNEEEMNNLINNGVVFISFLHGIVPHVVGTSFEYVTLGAKLNPIPNKE
jgi:hypothetical protein